MQMNDNARCVIRYEELRRRANF